MSQNITSLWSKIEKNTDKIATQSFTVPSERTSERSGGRKRSELSGASKRVSGASKRTDERVAQYYSLYSWLLSTIVPLSYPPPTVTTPTRRCVTPKCPDSSDFSTKKSSRLWKRWKCTEMTTSKKSSNKT